MSPAAGLSVVPVRVLHWIEPELFFYVDTVIVTMGRILLIVLGLGTVLVGWGLYGALSDAEAPTLPDFYWGPKEKAGQKEDPSIRPFTIAIDENVLADLKGRLRLETSAEGDRLTPPLQGIGFQYGFNTNFLRKVTSHWLNKYDWKAREKALNKYLHFKTRIQGIDIHFQHVKPSPRSGRTYKETRPLLLLHGWPGSFVEFQKVIPLFTEPKDSDINFELIIPSIPGYGFSERAHTPGLGHVEAAQIFVKLMKRLGHEHFYVQGGDWGSAIGTDMAILYPKNVVAVHLNMCLSDHSRSNAKMFLASLYPALFIDPDEISKTHPMSSVFSTLLEETGYMHLQATKPDTLGVGLANSPSGLAAYILEKFSTWTNLEWRTKENGGLVPYYDLDDLLDNVMVYWVTNTMTSSTRFYAESFSSKERDWKLENVPVKVPSACMSNPGEFFIYQSKFHLTDKYQQMLSYTKAERGGHFTAFEVPAIFAKDVIQFFNLVERKTTVPFSKKNKAA